MAPCASDYRSCVICRRIVLVSTLLGILNNVCSELIPKRFGWTGYTSSIHWIAPVASGLLTGGGIFLIFLQCFNYIVDCYPSLYVPTYLLWKGVTNPIGRAASTIAANTILRSAIGCSFPLFSRQMMENLGVQWAGTMLGCIAVVMIPIPVLFKVYGPSMAAREK